MRILRPAGRPAGPVEEGEEEGKWSEEEAVRRELTDPNSFRRCTNNLRMASVSERERCGTSILFAVCRIGCEGVGVSLTRTCCWDDLLRWNERETERDTELSLLEVIERRGVGVLVLR